MINSGLLSGQQLHRCALAPRLLQISYIDRFEARFVLFLFSSTLTEVTEVQVCGDCHQKSHANPLVTMVTANWRTGGCVHVRGHYTHQVNKTEKAHALSLNKLCAR